MARVAIVRGNDPYEATYEALKLLADDIRVSKQPVFLKPNLLLTKKAPLVVTSPKVCLAAADYLREEMKIFDIKIGEGTTGGAPPSTFKSMQNNDYFKYLDHWEPVDLSQDLPKKWFPIYSPGYSDEMHFNLGISQSICNCPYLVSIPKFKTHDVLGLTLSLKNLMGTLTTAQDVIFKKIIARETTNVCSYMHGFGNKKPDKLTDDENVGPSKVALAANLIRLAKTVQPSLVVIDGIEAMEGNGPAHGTLKKLGLIIASTDFIAADTVATHIAGMDPLHIQYIHQAGRLGLGEYRLEHIKILGEPLNSIITPFRPHRLYTRAKFTEDQINSLTTTLAQNT